MNLHELGLKYGTDKAHYHNFTSVYEEKFKHLVNEKINFLEIGIEHGFSLKMWSDFFTEAKIFGADIHNKNFLDNDRIKTFIVNQEKIEDLIKLPSDLDLIVDDGGHTMLQQQITFNFMFKNKLKKGGIFILEDLHTSLPSYYNTHGSNSNNNTLNLLGDLKNKKLTTNNEYFINETDFNELLNMIESIEIFNLGTDSITSIIVKNK